MAYVDVTHRLVTLPHCISALLVALAGCGPPVDDAGAPGGAAVARALEVLPSGWTGVRQWGLSTDDSAEGVAVGRDGVVYVSGYDHAGPRFQGRVDAFAASGAPLWTVHRAAVYDHMSRGIAFSPAADRVYLAEQSKIVRDSNSQYAIVAALDPRDGGEGWSDTVDYLGDGGDYTVGSRVRVDPAGYVYFLGSYKRVAPNGGWEVGTFLARYDDRDPDAEGGVRDTLGPFPYPTGSFGDTFFTDAAPAGDGGWYASGHTPNALAGETLAGGMDGFLRRYDADGALRWTRRYGTPGEDYLGVMARLADGRLALGGGTDGVMGARSAGGRDALLLIVDEEDGEVLLAEQFGTAGTDHVVAIAATPDGALLLVGFEGGAGSGATATATGFVRRVDVETGHPLWHTRIDAGPAGSVVPLDVAMVGRDALDALIVGRVRGSIAGQPYAGGTDAFALRVTGDGLIP